jgi:TonB family protein
MFLPLLSKAFRKSIAVVAVLGISLSPAQVSAQRDRAAPEVPKKISKSAARAQAERQRAATAEAQRQRAAARAQAERQRAAAAEAQRQRAAARVQAENARLAQQQAYANQQALLRNTVPPTAQANNQARMLNVSDFIRSSDYPAGSMSRGEEGIAEYDLTLNNGRPASCKITRSSGFEELDEATCRLATERSLFDMSTLPKGNWSTYSDRVRWQIGPSKPRANSGNLTASQSISRIDPKKIRCQYSDGYVGFVYAGSPCIQATTFNVKQNPARVAAVAAIKRPTTGDVFEDGYTYGYRLWEAKFYPESQATLEETLARFPNHKRASYVRTLLGRAWLDDKKPNTAVKVFYDNYKTDPRGDRAPDSLFFLGSALTDLGKTAEACEAFGELERAYPDAVTNRLVERLALGKARAKCK